ncbi:MAG: CoB--CoM heterodisulfide reductase iron-sulfur subunit B family protein [bacterium]
MKLSYYPGCSLKGTAREYDWSIQWVAEKLGIELTELPQWNCCGASSAHMTNHELSHQLSSRNLALAEEGGRDVVVPCPACFQRLRAAQLERRGDVKDRGIEILGLTDLLGRAPFRDAIREALVQPLAGLRVACYYGCLSLRPPKVTGALEWEHPMGLDALVEALGAEPVRWSHKTECCSGSLSVARPDIARGLIGDILAAARKGGAAALVTDCPMCQGNLESRQVDPGSKLAKGDRMPVFYMTELVALALGRPAKRKYWRKHLVNPRSVLSPVGL